MDIKQTLIWKTLQQMANNFIAFIPNIIIAVIILIGVYFLSKLTKNIIMKLLRRTRHNIGIVLGGLSRWAIAHKEKPHDLQLFLGCWRR